MIHALDCEACCMRVLYVKQKGMGSFGYDVENRLLQVTPDLCFIPEYRYFY